MSAKPQTLSEVRALAVQSLGDPESSQHFLMALGVTPEAFTALDEQAQAKHLQQLRTGEQNPQGNVEHATHNRYALAVQDAEAGLIWSIGGVWSASLLSQSPALMTGPEVDAFHKKHPNAHIVDVIVFREACEAYNAGFDSVLDHNERSTPESRQAARKAGIESLVRAGFPENALEIGKIDYLQQGNVSNHSDQAAQAELLGRNQAAIAERAFEAYNFGEGVAVTGASGWEYYAAGHERSRAVYVEVAIDDGKENSTTQLGFTVRFDPQTGALAEAYASDYTGQIWGSVLQGNVVNCNDLSSAELKQRGVALLSSFVTKAGLEADVLSSYDRQLHLKELGETLRTCMESAEGYPNEKFNGLAESVARCLVLYENKPDLYARIVRGVCSSESEMFLDTYQGLLLLNTLQRGLADDHDYSFNAATGTIERISETTAGNGLYPALLRDILESSQRASQENVHTAFKDGTQVFARGAVGSSILFAIGRVEGDDPKSESVSVELKQVMAPPVQGGVESSGQKFLHVSKAGLGEQALFKRTDVVEMSPLHVSRVIGLKSPALVAQIEAEGLGSVSPVKPPVPDQARIDLFAQTEHSVSIQWGWNEALLHSRGYTGQVMGAVADAAAAAEVKFAGVRCFFGDVAASPSVSLTGSDLPKVQAAAKEVAHVLLSFEGVEPVAARGQRVRAQVGAADYVFSERMQNALQQAIRVIHPNSRASRMIVEKAIAAPVNEVGQRWSAVLTAWPFVRSADFDLDDEEGKSLQGEFQAIFDAGVPSMNVELVERAKVQDDAPSPGM